MLDKICKTCKCEKILAFFPREMRRGKWYFLPNCKVCHNIIKKPGKIAYRNSNKDAIKLQKKKYYQNNKEHIIEKNFLYKQNNRSKYNEFIRNKRKNNAAFRLRESVRSMIKQALKGNKNGISINNYLGYTIIQLKTHLENQFESWMTWENQGRYNYKTWNDNDSSTWTWQIDHIIPQSSLSYISMEDGNFKKCWALDNLRPLSAKQNMLDGSRRTRH